MPSETDIDTLHELHRCSTPERWASFMALAGYLTEHPEQRLGQAVVNKLHDRAHPSRMFYASDDEARALLSGEEWTAQRGPER